jgi:GR25 family glycosyltransferase involved in LPS biosynthesis
MKNYKIKVVNLKRRNDRKKNIETIFNKINFEDYEFYEAVDGKNILLTLEIKNLFKNNDFCNRKGFIGCALSHYNIWIDLLKEKDLEYYIIFEDDIILSEYFNINFEKTKKYLKNNLEFIDILFLGYHTYNSNNLDINSYSNDIFTVIPTNKNQYVGGTFSYIITKNGAKKMLDYIDNNGIKHGIDYLFKINQSLNIYEVYPNIVFSKWVSNDNNDVDSDIQKEFECFDFDTIDDITNNKNINFIFIPNLDHHDDDIYFSEISLDEKFKLAEKDPNCIGFNTLGFFKNKIIIDNLKSSIYFKDNDGIYIKRSVYDDYLNKKVKINEECINIKMLCNWTSSEQLCKEWSNMCDYEFVWKNYKLVWTESKEDIDYYVIINYPPENSYFDPKKTIIFQMEPWVYNNNCNWGVKTWGSWAEPNPDDFLAVRGRKTNFHNNAFWQLELSLNELTNPKNFKKTKGSIISSIISSKYFDEGHISRIDFLKFLEKKRDVLLDIWNQDNKHNFSNYRGPLSPYVNKSNGLREYKYYFMVENNYEPNFITEKLWEPILCETLVFYYGCTNVTDYIDQNAFVLLDMYDFEKSYQLIKRALNEDWWSQRIDIIIKEKYKILNELAFFPTIDKIICENKKTYYEDEYNKYFKEYNNVNYKKLLNFLNNYYSSAWLEHLQFAMWLVHNYKPKIIVELGVDYGHSTFAFASEGIGNVYGIDSFEGDIHAGSRDTLKIFKDTKKYLLNVNLLHKDNIIPIKGYFDNIYETFNYDIDILHIDGLHTYEAVSNDFNKWITKTHYNSIILLHDVISFKDSVGKFFDEIEYPKTFFNHSAGLGVISKNKDIIDNINNVMLYNNKISDIKKYCFIHSCNVKEIGVIILTDIIDNLINNNLIQYFEKIFVVNIGEELNINYYKNNKIIIINYSKNINLYEIPTINLIRTFCEYNDNCEILYLHTKGVSQNSDKKISDWRNMMIYFLVNRYKDCFELLKEYDTIGCNYQEFPYKHYSGNFWWARSNYIKKLNNIDYYKERHEAEWWILSNKCVKYYEIHNSGINHYHKNYPPEKYIFLNKSIHIYSVFHNYFYDELYNDIENEEENKMITLYGVKNRIINTTKLNMIYEEDFKIYNPNFQKLKYNESSALYHLYKNNLYKKYDYIGLCQYDMKFSSNTIKDIKNIINNTYLNYIFNIGYFPDIKDTGFRGGHGIIINKINNLPSGLESYNKFFNTNYTYEHVIKNLLIACNTFVISSKMFENMMNWMEQYFIDDISLNKSNSDCDNPGCVIEGLVGMFLSLEVYKGAKYYPLDIKHIWPLYKNKSN